MYRMNVHKHGRPRPSVYGGALTVFEFMCGVVDARGCAVVAGIRANVHGVAAGAAAAVLARRVDDRNNGDNDELGEEETKEGKVRTFYHRGAAPYAVNLYPPAAASRDSAGQDMRRGGYGISALSRAHVGTNETYLIPEKKYNVPEEEGGRASESRPQMLEVRGALGPARDLEDKSGHYGDMRVWSSTKEDLIASGRAGSVDAGANTQS
ncbi:hypothetical protein B0H19DRAFT_1078164 [Mycena capillaripes]|nr:hypothetical protein B0H19DRAFT_1078164 [Mycena capillaripes]